MDTSPAELLKAVAKMLSEKPQHLRWEDCDVCDFLGALCPYHLGRHDQAISDLISTADAELRSPEPPVSPDGKVLRRRNGDAIPVREIMGLEAEGGSVVVFTQHQGRVAIAHGATAEWARHERDRIIREIWDSPIRIVRVLEYDPMNDTTEAK